MIVCGEFNSEYDDLSNCMLDESLTDLISEKDGPGPRTYKRSKNTPIDCCVDSPSFIIAQGGYISFGRLQSNRQGVWLELSTHQ